MNSALIRYNASKKCASKSLIDPCSRQIVRGNVQFSITSVHFKFKKKIDQPIILVCNKVFAFDFEQDRNVLVKEFAALAFLEVKGEPNQEQIVHLSNPISYCLFDGDDICFYLENFSRQRQCCQLINCKVE